jgi:hypothetical protein
VRKGLPEGDDKQESSRRGWQLLWRREKPEGVETRISVLKSEENEGCEKAREAGRDTSLSIYTLKDVLSFTTRCLLGSTMSTEYACATGMWVLVRVGAGRHVGACWESDCY